MHQPTCLLLLDRFTVPLLSKAAFKLRIVCTISATTTQSDHQSNPLQRCQRQLTRKFRTLRLKIVPLIPTRPIQHKLEQRARLLRLLAIRNRLYVIRRRLAPMVEHSLCFVRRRHDLDVRRQNMDDLKKGCEDNVREYTPHQ